MKLLVPPASPVALLPAVCASSMKRQRRKQPQSIELTPKPANWSQLTQREKTRWYSAQCDAITTREDKKWAALVESIQDKWPNNLTPDELTRQINLLNVKALADIYYGR